MCVYLFFESHDLVLLPRFVVPTVQPNAFWSHHLERVRRG